MSYSVREYLVEEDGYKSLKGTLRSRHKYRWAARLEVWQLNRIERKFRKKFPFPYWVYEIK